MVATMTAPVAQPKAEPYRVSVEEYKLFRSQGFLVVPGLVTPEEIAEVRAHTEDLMQGRLPEQQGTVMGARDLKADSGVTMQGLEAPPAHLSPNEKAEYFLRIHMLHQKLELHERYLLHPRVLDVLQALIGPDVLALQTMLFLKPPGKPGQGWHQDSYYIPTHPDSLCGAWIAIDDCDELNGTMWMATGSQHEPVYPPDIRLRLRRSDPGRHHRGRGRQQPGRRAERPDPNREPPSATAGHGEGGRCRLLRRAYPPPLQEELHHRPLPPRLRRPLLQRPLVHPVGRGGAAGPGDGRHEQLAHPGPGRHPSALRAAPLRHAVRRPASRRRSASGPAPSPPR